VTESPVILLSKEKMGNFYKRREINQMMIHFLHSLQNLPTANLYLKIPGSSEDQATLASGERPICYHKDSGIPPVASFS